MNCYWKGQLQTDSRKVDYLTYKLTLDRKKNKPQSEFGREKFQIYQLILERKILNLQIDIGK